MLSTAEFQLMILQRETRLPQPIHVAADSRVVASFSPSLRTVLALARSSGNHKAEISLQLCEQLNRGAYVRAQKR
jgi:hypothetical protein